MSEKEENPTVHGLADTPADVINRQVVMQPVRGCDTAEGANPTLLLGWSALRLNKRLRTGEFISSLSVGAEPVICLLWTANCL